MMTVIRSVNKRFLKAREERVVNPNPRALFIPTINKQYTPDTPIIELC